MARQLAGGLLVENGSIFLSPYSRPYIANTMRGIVTTHRGEKRNLGFLQCNVDLTEKVRFVLHVCDALNSVRERLYGTE